MVSDVDNQVAFLKYLDRGGCYGGNQLVGTGRYRVLVDENTRAEVLLSDVNTEVSHGLDTNRRLVAELNPQGAHLWKSL